MTAIGPCPSCQRTDEPKAHIGVVAICGFCGTAMVLEASGVLRRAVAQDFDALMPSARAALVKARSALVRSGPRPQ